MKGLLLFSAYDVGNRVESSSQTFPGPKNILSANHPDL